MVSYQALLQVLESNSFSLAAKTLGYTQSAVSQMIKSLETELGVTLLVRSRTGVALTREGEAMLPYIRDVARAHQALTDHAASLRGLEQGVVRIGSFNSVSSSLLPRAIQRFKQLHPAIRFELHQGLYQELEGLVRGGVVDFSFTDLCRPTEFASRGLFEDAYLAVLPQDHPLLRFDPIPRAAFVREPFILLDEGRGGATLRVFLAEHPDLDVQYRVGDDYSVLNMVENRLGVAVLPEMVARHAPSGVAVRQLNPPLRRRVGVIYRKETELSAAARAFLDVLDEVIADSQNN